MPQVPYTGAPSVEPNYAPTPSSNVNLPASAFGLAGAEASARLGGALGSAGNELFARASAMQEMDQQADVINAHAAVVDKIADKKVEFHSLQGAEAKNAFPQYKADIDKIITEGSQGLSSDYAKQLYGNQTRVLRSQIIESGAMHTATQFKNYQIGSTQANVDAANNKVGMFPEDEKVYKDSISAAEAAADEMQAHHGWSKAERDNYRTTQTDKAVVTRVKALADKGRITEAQSILDEGRKKAWVGGSTAVNADEFIQHKRNVITTRTEAPELLAGNGGYFGRGKVATDRLYNAITEDGDADKVDISSWVPEARDAGVSLPDKITKEQLATDRNLRKKVIAYKIGQLQEEAGSANGAVESWHKLNKMTQDKDVLVRDVNSRLAKSADRDELDRVADDRAEELAPGDINFREHFGSGVLTEHSARNTAEKEEYREKKAAVTQFLLPDPKTGKAPTSPDQIADPEFHKIWDNDKKIRAEFSHVFETNAKQGGYRVTDENNAEFYRIYNNMKSPSATDEQKNEALDQNFITKPWPQQFINKAIEAQDDLRKKAIANPPVEWAMKQFDGQLGNYKLKKGDAKTDQLRGEMRLLMEDHIKEHKKLPN